MNNAIYISPYNENNIRSIAKRMAPSYENLDENHIYWVAKELGIYPNGEPYKKSKKVYMTKMGSINRDSEYVANGRLNQKGIEAIEAYIIAEGYKKNKEEEEMVMEKPKSVWEQVDLISAMKEDYEKAVTERDKAKEEAESYCKIADEYEKQIEELKDKLLIAEKENNELKAEKKELSKMQIESVNFEKEIDSLQVRFGKYNKEVNIYISEVSELRKDLSALQTAVNRMQDNKKKLDGVLSDLVGCSKRLMNLK